MTAVRVGIVGLGTMGGAIGVNLLLRGFAVTGHDIDAARRDHLVGAGGFLAESAAGLAAASDIVLVSLPDESAFAAAVLDPTGLAAGVRPGQVVIETSTLPITLKERARVALAQRGAILLDCPLSGTGDQAARRDLVVLASGDPAALGSCRAVFDGFARVVHDLGPFGSGSKMKFIANHLVAIHNIAAAEALSLAAAAGLDLDRVIEVIGDGAGTSRMLEIRGPKMAHRRYEPGIRASVFQKDLRIIAGFAAQHHAPTPLLDACGELYAAAIASGHADDDTAAVFEVYRDRSGS